MLEYKIGLHVHCGITLISGRQIALSKLSRWHTYEGLIEGVPDKTMNDTEIDCTVKEVRFEYGYNEPFLIEPDRRDYLREPGDMQDTTTIDGLRPEFLPMVTSVARFRSFSAARNKRSDGSYLGVIWYQNEFDLPTDDTVIEAIRNIDWEQRAIDFEF